MEWQQDGSAAKKASEEITPPRFEKDGGTTEMTVLTNKKPREKKMDRPNLFDSNSGLNLWWW